MTATALHLPDEAATESLGAALQAKRPRHGCVHLTGDLGAGKTTLVRGFLRGAGHEGAVRSPTYTLIEPYELSGGAVFHLDLYRLSDPEELEFIGLRELLDAGLLLVEWPERGEGVLPAPGLHVHLALSDSGRMAHLEAFSGEWSDLRRMLDPVD
ncbi:tRNA (adenosine(37)-N6)-threonylcarbamoyltransferase complex ATPase subunit type 1 TsaE [Spiribacter onubensis]|uniref:tRNA threonylcarbamoyladenosine biosynthesis protein TsaE n=1 Tax=Spiribacter onubensis TaxID=3122420 RepID=A0ABV3S8U9_9GAMM